ncbi:hypothetical protein JCM16303_002191 [Sporobolomyces ruberrimus]
MRQSTTLLSLATLLFSALSVSAQTAQTISDQMNQLVVNIPEACLTTCSPWQTAYQQCPVANDATTDYSTCTCAADFIANYNACTGCMANSFNAAGDAADAQVATQAPADLATYCAAAGVVQSSTSLTSSIISTTSTTPEIVSTTSTETSPSSSSTMMSSDSSSSTASSSTAAGVVGAGGPASAGGPFPSQTKQPSAFTNEGNMVKLSGGVFVGLFMAMMMI